MNHSLKENLITTKDASELSGYTSDYLARLVRSGEIQGKRIGHSWVISSASLETFMTKQKGRKLDRARELASSRVREYNRHNQFVQRTTRALTEKISVPKFRLEEISIRSHSLALGVALVVVALGAVGANAAALPQVAQRASALATEISSGFVDTFGDVPTRIAVRMEEARIAVRADATRNALASRRAGYVASPVLASIDLETLRTVLVKEYRAPRATSDIAFSSSRTDAPILTVTDVYASVAGAYEFFANPSNIGTTLTDAYFAIGTDAYAAVDASFSAYRTLIDASGTPMLAAAATTRDALAHMPRLVAQVNLALGEAVIKATHAAIRTDVIAAHGLAAAAPESARIAVTLMGSTGDTLARAAEQVPARVATAYLNATAVPAVLAPRLAQAVFNAEYSIADRFVSVTNVASERYLALVEGTGDIAYESSTNARSIVQSASRTIAFAPAALEDVTLGTLGKSAAALDSVTHLSSFAAVLPALSASEKTALAVYEAIHSAFDSANRTLVAFFTTTPETVLPTGVPKARVIAVATSTRAVSSGTQPVTTLSYPTYTTVVRGVSEDFVNQSLASLRTNVLATVAGMIQPVSSQVVQNITTIQQLNRIDSLHDLVVQNGDFRNSIFDNGIRVNARDGYFDNLTAGTTTLATTTVNGTLTISSLTLTGSLSSPGSITGSYFVSTSTNATSTFAGSINIDNAGFVYATSTRNVGIGVLSPAALIAVQNSTSTQPIFVASNAAGAEVYRLTNDGFVGIGTTSPTYNLAVEGSSTLGNQAIAGYFTATTTTATSTFAGSFTVGTDKLVVNSTTGNIGIGTTSPYQRLSVAGNVIADTFIATSTTATSTFAGGFAVETDGLVYDYSSNNVGIGTASPANAKLDIRESASGAYGIKLTNRNATRTWGIATDVGAVNDNKFGIFDVTSGGARLTIDTSGYVGIGSTSPAQKLVVSGNILTDNANNNLSAYNIINRPTNATYDAANWYQTAGVSKWIAGLLAASSGGTANADDYSIAYYNGSWNNAVTINSSGRVGIGTTSPSGTLAVAGDFFLTGSTTITGADSGIVFTGSGNHDITAAGGTLRIGTNTIIGNIEALNDTVDIGTAITRFDKIYANEVNASTIVGTLTGGNLSAETFTINSDNATADTENAYLVFERGTITPNASLAWNAAEGAKRFEFNHPLFIQNASASTTLTTLDLKAVAGQTADIFRVASSSADTLFNVTASGNVGIGTTSPYQKLSVVGNVIADTFIATSTTATSTFAGGFAVETSGLVYDYSSNNVGIGTAGPSKKLSVAGDVLIGTPSGSSDVRLLVGRADGVGDGIVTATNFNAVTVPVFRARSGTSPTGDGIYLFYGQNVANTKTFSVDNSGNGYFAGNVGIGTTSPTTLLSLSQTTGPIITLENRNTALAAGEQIGGLSFTANDSSGGGTGEMAKLIAYTQAISSAFGNLGFYTRDRVGVDSLSEKMTIQYNGNVGIGTTSPYQKLSVAGNIIADTFIATSTTATSTFAGGFAVETSGLVYDYSSNNVGIGTAGPESKLSVLRSPSDILGETSIGLNYGAGDLWGMRLGSTDSYDFHLDRKSGSTWLQALSIDRTSGNVGIGSTSPMSKLSVVGESRITGVDSTFGADANARTSLHINANTGSLAEVAYESAGSLRWKVGKNSTTESGSNVGSDFYFNRRSDTGTDLGTAMLIQRSTGNVGIGTTSPASKLNIYAGASGGGANTSAPLTVESNTTAFIGLLTPNASASGILFGNVSNNAAGGILYNSEVANGLSFRVNGNSVKMVINSSGNVGIGTTTPIAPLSVLSASSADQSLAQSWSYNSGADLYNLKLKQIVTSGVVKWGFDIQNAGTSYSDVLILDRGNVGIGTTNPQKMLDVSTSTDATLRLTSTKNDSSWTSNTDTAGVLEFYKTDASGGGADVVASIKPIVQNTAGSEWDLGFSVGETLAEQFRISDAGYLESPTTAKFIFNDVSGGVLQLRREDLTVASGETIGELDFLGTDASTNMAGNLAKILVAAEADQSTSAATYMAFHTNTGNAGSLAEAMRISSTGNVGIGVTAPAIRLSIKDSSSQTAYTTSSSAAANPFVVQTTEVASGSGYAALQRFYGGLGNSIWYQGLVDNGVAFGGSYVIGNRTGAAAYQEQLRITSTGNVGIGTSTPNTKLNVLGSSGTQYSNSIAKFYAAATQGVYIGYNTTDKYGYIGAVTEGVTHDPLVLEPSGGNVGIGTTSPADILDIYSAATNRVFLQASTSVGYAEYGLSADQGRGSRSTLIQYGSAHATLPNALQLLNFNNADLALGTNNTRRVTISGSGLVGIGTTTPAARLVVSETISQTAIFDSTSASGPYIAFSLNGTRNGYLGNGGALGNSASVITLRSEGDLALNTGTTPRLYVTNTGNVGIGTSTPERLLQVHGTNTEVELSSGADEYARLYFRNGDGTGEAGRKWLMGQYGGSAGNPFVFTYAASTGSNWVDALAITNTGNVGIGTTSPGVNLVVAGSGHVYSRVDTTGTSHVAGSYLTTPTTELDFMSFGGYSTSRFSTSTVGYSAAYAVTGGLMLGTYGASDVIIGSNNTDRIHILSTGNVGIGTTSPAGTLQLGGSAPHFLIGTGADVLAGGQAGLLISNGTEKVISGVQSSLGFIGTYSNTKFGLATNNSTKVTIDTTGYVGIGTTSPADTLDVNGGVRVMGQGTLGFGAGMEFSYNSTTGGGITTYDRTGSAFKDLNANALSYHFLTSSAEKVTILNSGNVGIGTSSPGNLLQLHSASSNPGVWMSGGTITQPFTSVGFTPEINANVSGTWGQSNATYGGLQVNSFTTNGNANTIGLTLQGHIGSASPSDDAPAIVIAGWKSNGSTGRSAMSGTNTVLQVRAGSTNLVTVQGSGNVGIGTTTPATALQINTSSLEVARLVGTNATGGYLSFFGNTSTVSGFLGSDGAVSGGGGASVSDFGFRTPGGMVFRTGGAAARMTILSTGYVGVGTTTPTAALHVNGGDMHFGDSTNVARNFYAIRNAVAVGGFSTSNSVFSLFGGAVATPMLTLIGSGNVGIGTAAPAAMLEIATTTTDGATLRLTNSDTAVAAGEALGSLDFYSSDASTSGAGIRAYLKAVENDGGVGRSYDLALGTGAAAAATEKLRITSSGNVGIGTTTPGAKLQIGSSSVTPVASATPDAISLGNMYSTTAGSNLKLKVYESGSVSLGLGVSALSLDVVAGQTGAGINFYTNAGSTAKMTISSTGNVGIGSTTPGSLLSVLNSALTTYATSVISSSVSSLETVNSSNVSGQTSTLKLRASSNGGTVAGIAGISAVQTDWTANSADIAFQTNSLGAIGERMRITAAGNVGIGSSTPVSKLSVAGTGDITAEIQTTSSTNAAGIKLTGGTQTWGVYSIGSSGVKSGALGFYDHGSSAWRLLLDNAGNVGIGTTSPLHMLSVTNPSGSGTNLYVAQFASNAGANVPLVAYSDSAGSAIVNQTGSLTGAEYIYMSQAGNMTFNTAGSEQMRITSTGNIGIGTTTPSAKLHILDTTSVSTSGQTALVVGSTYSAGTVGSGGKILFEDQSTGTDSAAIRGYTFGSSKTGLAFDTGWGALTTKMVIDNSGNIGIGTTSPYSRLSVWGADTTAGVNMFELTNSASTTLLSMDNAGNLNVPVATATTTLGGGLNVNSGGLVYDLTTGITSAANLSLGATTFDTDAGVVQWVDMPVTSASASGTVESYTASLNANPMLTVYGLADGIGGMTNLGVGIGSTSPWATLSVTTAAQQSGLLPLFQVASTTNAELFTVNGNGNVGIGTTSPDTILTVFNSAAASASGENTLKLSADYHGNVIGSGGRMVFTNNAVDLGKEAADIRGYTFGTNLTGLAFGTGYGAVTTKMVIDNAGLVGIGTTSPFAKLAVQATAGGSTPLFTIASSTSGAATSTAFHVASNGNVGIGTASPGANLETFGGINALPTASGSVNEAGIRVRGGGNVVSLDFGSKSAGPASSWIQSRNATDYSTNYPLLLNPNGGNVGIGTTNPEATLSTLTTISATDAIGFLARSQRSDGSYKSQIRTGGTTSDMRGDIFFERDLAGTVLNDFSAMDVSLMIDGGTGNVGIGTTSPLGKLHVYQGASGQASLPSTRDSLVLENSAPNGIAFLVPSGQNSFITFGDAADNDIGYLGYSHADDSLQFATNNSERLRITSTGNVGIGTTSPATKLEVGGNTANVTFDGYLNCAGFTSDANGKLACTASDERLKQNITSLATSSALAGINALNPVSFNWRDPSMGNQEQFGLIAQQVETVFPNLVQRTNPTELTPGGTLTVNYPGFISPMILAIQELDARTRQILGSGGVLSLVPGVESQCVTGDTRLRRRRRCVDGSFEFDEVDIKDVVAGDEIQSLEERTGSVVYSRVNGLIDMGEQEVYELVTKSGRRIRTTANHPFLARRPSAELASATRSV